MCSHGDIDLIVFRIYALYLAAHYYLSTYLPQPRHHPTHPLKKGRLHPLLPTIHPSVIINALLLNIRRPIFHTPLALYISPDAMPTHPYRYSIHPCPWPYSTITMTFCLSHICM
jgi:hypothetical protein